MPTHSIDTVVHIEQDRRLVVQLPSDVSVGRHRVVAVLNEVTEELARQAGEPWSFPVLSEAKWPPDMPLTREEMYDDHGR